MDKVYDLPKEISEEMQHLLDMILILRQQILLEEVTNG
jgi:hypothetical protein